MPRHPKTDHTPLKAFEIFSRSPPRGLSAPNTVKLLFQIRELKKTSTDTKITFFVFRYEDPEIALNCGMMLRECIRHEPLGKLILNSSKFDKFFGYVELSTFDIASDAFATFKV